MNKNQTTEEKFSIGSPHWLVEIRKGNSKLVADLYRRYKKDFVRWIQSQTSCSNDFAVDVFQDSVLALYENIKKGKITTFEHGVGKYLFGIGKKVYYMHVRKKEQKKVQMISIEEKEHYLENLSIQIPLSNLEDVNPMLKLLLKMKEPCKSILYLYYYREYRTAEIADELKYKNENVVRVQKARCMSALRKIYHKKTSN